MELVVCQSLIFGSGKGVRGQLCTAPEGPFRQLTPDPFTQIFSVDKALEPLSSAT